MKPLSFAGDDRRIDASETVTLDGFAYDEDGTITTYTWSQLEGPTVALSEPSTASASFTMPVLQPNEALLFELTVSDDRGASASDSVSIGRITEVSFYKVIEAVSDKKGEIFVSGIHKPGVNDPRIVVYKKGYIAWRGDTIFPGYEERWPPFKWRDGYVFELEHFKPEYSHEDHVSFLRGSNSAPMSGLLNEAFRWEALLKYR